MKKLIARLETTVRSEGDIKDTLYKPTIYDTKYGRSVIFEHADNKAGDTYGVGCWSIETIANLRTDRLCVDMGQEWFMDGFDAIKEELKQYIL